MWECILVLNISDFSVYVLSYTVLKNPLCQSQASEVTQIMLLSELILMSKVQKIIS